MKVTGTTVGPWWVGGKGWIYETAYITDEGVMSRAQLAARQAARELHVELSRLGIRDHYAFASRVLGREVFHLSALSPDERNRIREAAYELVHQSESKDVPLDC